MAYESNESGEWEIYVRPFPDVDSGRWQISTQGGVQPVWSANGRELFYRALSGASWLFRSKPVNSFTRNLLFNCSTARTWPARLASSHVPMTSPQTENVF